MSITRALSLVESEPRWSLSLWPVRRWRLPWSSRLEIFGCQKWGRFWKPPEEDGACSPRQSAEQSLGSYCDRNPLPERAIGRPEFEHVEASKQ